MDRAYTNRTRQKSDMSQQVFASKNKNNCNISIFTFCTAIISRFHFRRGCRLTHWLINQNLILSPPENVFRFVSHSFAEKELMNQMPISCLMGKRFVGEMSKGLRHASFMQITHIIQSSPLKTISARFRASELCGRRAHISAEYVLSITKPAGLIVNSGCRFSPSSSTTTVPDWLLECVEYPRKIKWATFTRICILRIY